MSHETSPGKGGTRYNYCRPHLGKWGRQLDSLMVSYVSSLVTFFSVTFAPDWGTCLTLQDQLLHFWWVPALPRNVGHRVSIHLLQPFFEDSLQKNNSQFTAVHSKLHVQNWRGDASNSDTMQTSQNESLTGKAQKFHEVGKYTSCRHTWIYTEKNMVSVWKVWSFSVGSAIRTNLCIDPFCFPFDYIYTPKIATICRHYSTWCILNNHV